MQAYTRTFYARLLVEYISHCGGECVCIRKSIVLQHWTTDGTVMYLSFCQITLDRLCILAQRLIDHKCATGLLPIRWRNRNIDRSGLQSMRRTPDTANKLTSVWPIHALTQISTYKEFSCSWFKTSTMKVSLLFVFCVCYFVGLAVSSHFRGGIIQWRPVNPRAFNGEVSFYTITMLLYRTTNAFLMLYIWLPLSHIS